MIRHLDQMLRDLLTRGVPDVVDELQVGFSPPDDDWRAYVDALTVDGHPANALNVYLLELRENRSLRSNEVFRTSSEGWVTETRAPARLDCHYLITAWSPASVTPGIEPAWDEHSLLYDVASLLLHNDPLLPAEIYATGYPAGFPEALQQAELPIAFVPAEGFPKYAEFWGTMGAEHRWRPAIHLTVTLPVLHPTPSPVPVVTTSIARFGVAEVGRDRIPGRSDLRLDIGGYVLDGTSSTPGAVQGAWVELETLAGQRLRLTRTDADGRFRLGYLDPGQWPEGPPTTLRLRAQHQSFTTITREVELPSGTGEYDLTFT